tara:strand:+ start:2788 stop:3621 length:834 start_codon:yes stop_codon:yes gene_type:complete
MSRSRLFTTFPARLLREPDFLMMDTEERCLLLHLYAYTHPQGSGWFHAIALNAAYVPQLFPNYESLFGQLQSKGFINMWEVDRKVYFELNEYDIDQPAQLLKRRGRRDVPLCDPNVHSMFTQCSPNVHSMMSLDIDRDIDIEEKRREKAKPVGSARARGLKVNTSSDEGFNEFWKEYPRRVKKKDAFLAWQRITKTTGPNLILDGLSGYKEHCDKSQTSYMHPTSWLNAERWEDDYTSDEHRKAAAAEAGLEAIREQDMREQAEWESQGNSINDIDF